MTVAMTRTDCLAALAERVTVEPVVVAVGGLVDEWHHLLPRDLNYFTGGMGLASSIGLGLSLARPDRKVIVLDGDGALLMSLGSLASAAHQAPDNLLHLVFNNGTYDSSGGFTLPAEQKLRFHEIASAAGIEDSRQVDDLATWRDMVPDLLSAPGHAIVVLKVVTGDSVPMMTGDKLEYRFRFQRALQ